MARKHHHSISRQSSREPSASPHRGDNLFSDENAIEDFGVADGYQPTFNLQDMSSRTQQQPRRSSNTQRIPSPIREAKKKPSISQPNPGALIPRNSFSLRHDAQYSDAPRRIPSISSATGHNEENPARPSSILSRQSTFVRPQSTYAGPLAPSHPYGMYPQNSTEIAHRGSVASSHRPTRELSYYGRDRPTHPYAMYPQNIASESETDPLTASADIASVGFPGLAHQYARRLGPDGEEADDIIGPDGHTEQLPPYTQYPDTGSVPLKQQARGAPAPLSPIPQEASQEANSATSINDTLLSPTAYDPTIQMSNDGNSVRPLNEKWREKSKRRTCCGRLPLWAVVLIIIILIGLSAMAGGLIGRQITKTKWANSNSGASNSPDSSSAAATTTTAYNSNVPTFGAIPLPTTYTGPLTAPTGSYNLLISSPSDSSATCLQSQQQVAWNCMGGSTVMGLSVQNPMTGPAIVQLTGPLPDPNTNPLLYGDQYPAIQGNVSASNNLDPDDKASGATLYFHAAYDKHVLVPFDEITATQSKRSIRTNRISASRQIRARGAHKVQDSALLWDCVWPNTDLDGFIYVNVPTRAESTTTSTSATSVSTPTNVAGRGLSRVRKGQTATNLYTRKVKLVEYRDETGTQPVCILMQFSNSVLTKPANPPNGVPGVINLQEIEAPHQKSMSPYWRYDKSDYRIRDPSADGYCFCEWVIT